MVKRKYAIIRAPVEFKDWIKERKMRMENIAYNLGFLKKNKSIPMTNIMSVISKTDGVNIDDNVLKQFSLRRRKKSLI